MGLSTICAASRPVGHCGVIRRNLRLPTGSAHCAQVYPRYNSVPGALCAALTPLCATVVNSQTQQSSACAIWGVEAPVSATASGVASSNVTCLGGRCVGWWEGGRSGGAVDPSTGVLPAAGGDPFSASCRLHAASKHQLSPADASLLLLSKHVSTDGGTTPTPPCLWLCQYRFSSCGSSRNRRSLMMYSTPIRRAPEIRREKGRGFRQQAALQSATVVAAAGDERHGQHHLRSSTPHPPSTPRPSRTPHPKSPSTALF